MGGGGQAAGRGAGIRGRNVGEGEADQRRSDQAAGLPAGDLLVHLRGGRAFGPYSSRRAWRVYGQLGIATVGGSTSGRGRPDRHAAGRSKAGARSARPPSSGSVDLAFSAEHRDETTADRLQPRRRHRNAQGQASQSAGLGTRAHHRVAPSPRRLRRRDPAAQADPGGPQPARSQARHRRPEAGVPPDPGPP